MRKLSFKNKCIAARVPIEYYDAIASLADDEGTTITVQLNRAVKAYVDEHCIWQEQDE